MPFCKSTYFPPVLVMSLKRKSHLKPKWNRNDCSTSFQRAEWNMWWNEYWATPSSTTGPDSDSKQGAIPETHWRLHWGLHTHTLHGADVALIWKMMVRWQTKLQRGDSNVHSYCVFTLAICSSTIQCLMDSTILWKREMKKNWSTENAQPKWKTGRKTCWAKVWLTQVVSFKFSIFCKKGKKGKKVVKSNSYSKTKQKL